MKVLLEESPEVFRCNIFITRVLSVFEAIDCSSTKKMDVAGTGPQFVSVRFCP